MKLPKLKCTRCSHSWIPRQENPPKVCSKCNSPYWNKKRVTKKKSRLQSLMPSPSSLKQNEKTKEKRNDTQAPNQRLE